MDVLWINWRNFHFTSALSSSLLLVTGGCGSSVGRERDSWWGRPGSNVCCGSPLPTSWVGVSIMWPAETEVIVSPLSHVSQHVKLSDVSLGTRPQYSLAADKDVNKSNKQNKSYTNNYYYHNHSASWYHPRFLSYQNAGVPCDNIVDRDFIFILVCNVKKNIPVPIILQSQATCVKIFGL